MIKSKKLTNTSPSWNPVLLAVSVAVLLVLSLLWSWLSVTPKRNALTVNIPPNMASHSTNKQLKLPAGWQPYINNDLGFQMGLPNGWLELDTRGYREPSLKCFGKRSGEPVFNYPQLCVEFNPVIVNDGLKAFPIDKQEQQKFFDDLANSRPDSFNSSQLGRNGFQRRLEINGVSAVEVLDMSIHEGTELYYTTFIYINSTKHGFVKLSLADESQAAFSTNEAELRGIVESFLLF